MKCAGGKQRFLCKQDILVACFHADFLLGLFLEPENGGDMFLRNVVDIQRTTRRYIPEDSTLHNHRCENRKSYTD
jgi:hypothetical protein